MSHWQDGGKFARELREARAALTASREREKMLAEALAEAHCPNNHACGARFAGEGAHNAMCSLCRALAAYREAGK